MRYLTRLSYNSSGWQYPTGEARQHEDKETYNRQNGFGLEDWLFRNDWLIGDWRYAFLQGVNRSYKRLNQANEPFDVTLFSIEQPSRRRRYVATIRDVECLAENQAQEAVAQFQKNGWIDSMRKDLENAVGRSAALGADTLAKDILNIRFRLEKVSYFERGVYAEKGDPILRLDRYTLNDLSKQAEKADVAARSGPRGNDEIPNRTPYLRRAIAPVTVTPEHARMQAMLVAELKSEFPNAHVVCEEDYVDVTVQTESERILFEIKSDLDPKAVIRQALGQILEYAFHPPRKNSLTVRLVIVGRNPLNRDGQAYLNHLRSLFALPLEYRVVSL